MDKIETWRTIIESVLTQYAQIPYAYGEMECHTVFDRMSDRYLLITVGWHGKSRVHGCIVHLDIIDGKVWLQRDNTDYQIAKELEKAGIPKKEIVLGFQLPEARPYTEYAVA
ncbi:MAG: XisI protein [Caldilineaceae bacterium]